MSQDLLAPPFRDPHARRVAWLALVFCLGARAFEHGPDILAFITGLK